MLPLSPLASDAPPLGLFVAGKSLAFGTIFLLLGVVFFVAIALSPVYRDCFTAREDDKAAGA